MPTYHVEVQLEISTGAGQLRSGRMPTGALHAEIQLIQEYCKLPCAHSTVEKRAITQARAFALAQLVRYQFTNATVRTIGARVVAVTLP